MKKSDLIFIMALAKLSSQVEGLKAALILQTDSDDLESYGKDILEPAIARAAEKQMLLLQTVFAKFDEHESDELSMTTIEEISRLFFPPGNT
jgi:hypothetical protein